MEIVTASLSHGTHGRVQSVPPHPEGRYAEAPAAALLTVLGVARMPDIPPLAAQC